MLERKKVRAANEDLPVIMEMNAASKMKLEKRMINLSFIGSVLFVVAEGVMAYISHSHAILMDCVFDVTDLIMIGPFLVLVPLLYRPVTERRPYGFSQVESLFLVIKYSVLLVVTIQLLIDSVQSILHGGHMVNASQLAGFEFGVFAGCLIIYFLLHYFSKRYASVVVKAEMYNWKLDVVSSFGVFAAFFGQFLLQKTPYEWLAPYIDPVVAIVMALILIVEPVKMILHGLRELVLFAPEQEVMDQIRSIAEQYMQTCSYTIEFLDVIQTGRKTWVEIYIDSPNDIITMQSLTRIRNGIREELKKYFDDWKIILVDVKEMDTSKIKDEQTRYFIEAIQAMYKGDYIKLHQKRKMNTNNLIYAANAFRVRPVMTTSIHLQIKKSAYTLLDSCGKVFCTIAHISYNIFLPDASRFH